MAHLAGSHRMIDGHGVRPHVRLQTGAVCDARPRQRLVFAVDVERRGHDGVSGQFQAVHQHVHVGALAQVVGFDQRCLRGVGAGEANLAPAGGLDERRQQREMVAVHLHETVVQEQRRAVVVLQVGRVQTGPRLHEPARLGDVTHEHAALLAHVQRHLRLAQRVFQAGGVCFVNQRHEQVVLQILSHAWQLVQHAHARRFQLGAVPDARQHQQMRRGDGPGAQNDTPAGMHRVGFTFQHVFHACRRAVFQNDARDVCPGLRLQVGALQGRAQVGRSGAPAHTALLRHLIAAHALLLRAVEVVAARIAERLEAFHDGVADGVGVAPVLDVQWPARTVIGVCPVLVVLGPPEVGQHIVVSPTTVARLCPGVVVAAVAPDVDHGVDAAAPAQHFPAWPVQPAPVQVRLRLCLVVPVERRLEQLGKRRRNADLLGGVGVARFEQQHLTARVFAQAVRHDAPRRTRAHNHEINRPVIVHTWPPARQQRTPEPQMTRPEAEEPRFSLGAVCARNEREK